MNAAGLVAVPPAVITTISLAGPAVPAGVTAVIVVDETTVKVVATPPIVKLVAPVRFVPVIVIAVAPNVEPELGDTLIIVGNGVYVNALGSVATPPAVVTETSSGAPTVPAGVTAVIVVALETTKLAAAALPNFTLVAAVNPVPVIVIVVPPRVGPLVGLMLLMTGTGVPSNVNAPVLVALPPIVVSTTSFAPAVPAGVTAVTDVALTTLTLVAAVPPTVTLLVPVKLVPVIVIVVPPEDEPDVGATVVMVGAATYVNAPVWVTLPPGVVNTTSFRPAVPAAVIAVTEVALSTFTLVAATPPTTTLLAPVKLVPVMVIVVPPKAEPDVGETVVMVGAATYVNAPVLVTLPPGVVNTTSFKPAVDAPVTAVTEVALTTATLVAATPPTTTLLAPVKLVPVMVMVVAPAMGPNTGATVVMVGTAI